MALSEVVKQFLAARKPLNQRFGESLERDIMPYPDEAPPPAPPSKPLNQRFGESLERDVMGEGMAPAPRENLPPRPKSPVNVELDRATGPGAWWTKGYPSLRSEAVENEKIGGGPALAPILAGALRNPGSLERDLEALPSAQVPERLGTGTTNLPMQDLDGPVNRIGPRIGSQDELRRFINFEDGTPALSDNDPRRDRGYNTDRSSMTASQAPPEAPGTTRQASRVSAPQGPVSALPEAQEFVPEPVYPEAMSRMSFSSRPESQAQGNADPDADLRRAFVTEYPDDLGDAALKEAQERDRRAVAMADARDGFRHAASLISGAPQQGKVNPNAVAVEEFLRRRGVAKENSEGERAMAMWLLKEKAAAEAEGRKFDAQAAMETYKHNLDMQGNREQWKVEDERRRLDRESQERIARNRASSGGLFGGAANEDYAQAIADAIERGDQPPDMKGLYRYGGPVRAILGQKGFDLTTANRDWQAVTRHLSTLNGPQQERLRQAVAFTYDSVDVVEKLYKEWQAKGTASGVKLFNKASLAASKNLPGEAGAAAQALEAQINDLVSELATVYKGGNSSTDESLKLAAQNLSADWNPETFQKALGLLRTNLKIRRNSIFNSQPVGASEGSVYVGKPGDEEPSDDQPPEPGAVKSKSGKWMKKNAQGQWEYL